MAARWEPNDRYSGGRGGGVILGGDTAKEPLDGKGRTDRHPAQKDAALFHSPLGGCEALGLPYRKDPEARKAMLRLAQPKKHKYKTTEAREQDLALLLQRCISDVESLRACSLHPRMHPLSPGERQIVLLDAKINGHGVRLNVPFV